MVDGPAIVSALSDAVADDVVRWCTAIGAVAGIVALTGRTVMGILRSIVRMGTLADELLGDGDRPSLTERLDELGRRVDDVRAVAARTEATLSEHVRDRTAHPRVRR